MKVDIRGDTKALRSLYSGHQHSAALTALCLLRRACYRRSPEGHLTDPLKAVRSLRSACHYSGMKHACRSADQGTWLTRLQAPASVARTCSNPDLILHCCCGMHAQKFRSKTVQAHATETCRVRKLGPTSVLSCRFLPHFDHLLHAPYASNCTPPCTQHTAPHVGF